MLLDEKVVLISGVGPGLGQALAMRSALAGADVVLAARTEARLSEVAGKVAATGRRALVVPTDITNGGRMGKNLRAGSKPSAGYGISSEVKRWSASARACTYLTPMSPEYTASGARTIRPSPA